MVHIIRVTVDQVEYNYIIFIYHNQWELGLLGQNKAEQQNARILATAWR